MTRPRILHVHSTFSLGGKEARAVRLMNAFGDQLDHVVLSGVPGALGAREAIGPHVPVSFPTDHPPLTGRPGLGRLRDLARYMAGFDLVLSYNWGAMDAVMARRLFGGPPLIHHEDGFNSDEAERQKWQRVLFRRLALGGAEALVVPSQRLEAIALGPWRQPRARVRRIANGIAVEAYAVPPAADAIPGFRKLSAEDANLLQPVRAEPVEAPPFPREAKSPSTSSGRTAERARSSIGAGEVVIGTLAGLRTVKNLPRLVRAFAASGAKGRLVIVGEGETRDAILAEAARRGVADRVLLPGFLADPALYVGLFDIFALSSDSEQFPISVVEAMAAGLPVATTEVGDIRAMVAAENLPFVTPLGNEAGLAASLASLAADPTLRARIGRANQAKARDQFSEGAMIAAYAELYGNALGFGIAP